MTVQKLGDRLQDIAHAGDSLSRVYIQKGEKLKENNAVPVYQLLLLGLHTGC